MCEVWPGPRCNDKCQSRDIKRELFYQVSKAHGRHSVEYKNAIAELLESQNIYDTTPKGIKELRDTVADGEDESLIHMINVNRLVQGLSTREMQIQALKEIQNGRVNALSKIVAAFINYYSEEEISSIIASARENKERNILGEVYINALVNKKITKNNIDETVSKINANSGSEYYEYLDKITHALKDKFQGSIPKEYEDELQKLEELPPPSEINLQAYRSVGNAIQKAQESTRGELMRISAIQDSSPAVVAEYFDAYRKYYEDNYSKLPPTEQPNPPKEWIEGSIPNSGLMRNPETSFIPRDPATMYAIFKLRTDLNAIPDYLKQSTKLSSIDYAGDEIIVTHVTRTGKELKKESFERSELKNIIKRDVKDSVVIIPEMNKDILKTIKEQNRIVLLEDIAKKNFNTTSRNSMSLASEFKTQENTLSIYGAMRKKILKTWATKQARVNSSVLDFTPKGESRSIKLVR